MFKGLGDMAGLMKQAHEMQSKMAEAQEKLEDVTVEGSAGAGLVSVIVNAKGRVERLNIDASLLTPDDKDALEDLILAAIQDGQTKATAAAGDEMSKLTEGLNLPAGFKLPFS